MFPKITQHRWEIMIFILPLQIWNLWGPEKTADLAEWAIQTAYSSKRLFQKRIDFLWKRTNFAIEDDLNIAMIVSVQGIACMLMKPLTKLNKILMNLI